jgi:hypothetical protein
MYHGFTHAVLRDTQYTKITNLIHEVTDTLQQTERERSKQEKAIFGVMSMINIAGGM